MEDRQGTKDSFNNAMDGTVEKDFGTEQMELFRFRQGGLFLIFKESRGKDTPGTRFSAGTTSPLSSGK